MRPQNPTPMFDLKSKFDPTPDQFKVISQLLTGLDSYKEQTLKGITGSGKTFVLANVISQSNAPSIVLAPNKVLAYQLYKELLEFFPNNFIGYYVSNYEVYIPAYYSHTLNDKVEAKVQINMGNKILRTTVRDFLESSDKAILVCSSTILFPTFKEDLYDLLDQHKGYIIRRLHEERGIQVKAFKDQGKIEEANRLDSNLDHTISSFINPNDDYVNANIISLLKEKTGSFYLTSYFEKVKPNLYIDESHLSLLQLKAMPLANAKRLKTLIEKGYYLSNVWDDSILNTQDLKDRVNNILYVSATPSDYEINHSNQVVELLTRPNGIVDPKLTIKSQDYFGSQKMLGDIKNTISKGETVFINCISRRQVLAIHELLNFHNIESEYIHFKVKQDERKQILEDLRNGEIQVIIGINMLREGIDVKQCSLVIVEQASRNNFLRTKSCLIQIAGRAARNVNGKVFMCCDHISSSLQETIEEIDHRREVQLSYLGS